MAETIQTFDDWIGAFQEWQKEIGFNTDLLGDFKFEAKFQPLEDETIPFGDYKGQKVWRRYLDIPTSQIRDSLLHLIVYQGDTEFASVEQQRELLNMAPTEYDLKSALRIMSEEMRHGWQMCYLMCEYFGETGRTEAKKQLERHAYDNNRLLGSFNQPVDHWIDFFVYTQFVDRDGKYQLKMLSNSAFAPLAESMGPMLKEESFHLGTGYSGLQRIVRQGKVPLDVLQRYYNKWVPTAFDLFGKDGSSTAHWSYVWGIKGRYDERENAEPAVLPRLNAYNRGLYHQEIEDLQRKMNLLIPDGATPLAIPNEKFNRGIGDYEDHAFTVEGEPIDENDYEDYLKSVLPTQDDKKLLNELFEQGDWIAPKGAPK
jgi:benzoyl-CoA 2,3-dioxygenase component B